jgi:hypothetical protein
MAMSDHINSMKKKGTLKSKHWIAGAIEHPGSFTKAAAKAGKSVHELAEADKGKGGVMGKRARLALTLSKLRKQ